MNKTAIKNYAVWARVQLIEAAKQRAYAYAVTADGENRRGLETVDGRLLTPQEKSQRDRLIDEIGRKGYAQVMEEAAYTWFDRFIALRFMEVNGYLPAKVRVFTDESGAFRPQILREAMTVELEGLAHDRVLELLERQDNEALYKYLLITQCNALNEGLPYMFERIANWTELLFPPKLLRADSVIGRMVSDIPAEDFREEVEIIGWLYQYYISEKHEEVVDPLHGKVVKKEDIPAATQLFTTDWVVRYILDNSLGRYWIERHPESRLAEKLPYYVTSKDGKQAFVNEPVRPEELTVFDPCVGSGHFLAYAFDILLEIYRECGWSDRDAARFILENNLYGLDIDDRAVQLACFAIAARARKYDRKAFSGKTDLHIFAIQEPDQITDDLVRYFANGDGKLRNDIETLCAVFENAKEYGSTISVPPLDLTALYERADIIRRSYADDVFQTEHRKLTEEQLLPLIRQAEILSQKYDVVATNPPYLNKYSPRLKEYVGRHFSDHKGDLFSVFIYRNFGFCKENGFCGFMTPNVWMFIKSYENLRNYILNEKSIVSLIQMAKGAFFKEATVDICTFILKNAKGTEKGLYFRLEDFKGDMEVQKQKVLEALANKDCGYFYEADQSNFAKIPGNPVAYWASKSILRAFEKTTLSMIANPKVGLQTGENNRFTRLWYEILFDKFKVDANSNDDALNSRKKWFPYNKGGEFRKWYGNNDYIINWENNGWEIKHFTDDEGKLRSRPQNTDTYFHESITWSKISSGTIAFRYKPAGHIYDVAGTSIFADTVMLYYLAGFCNSCVAVKFAQMLSPTVNYEVGHISNFPVAFSDNLIGTVTEIVNQCILISKNDWDTYETSWDFKRHPLV